MVRYQVRFIEDYKRCVQNGSSFERGCLREALTLRFEGSPSVERF